MTITPNFSHFSQQQQALYSLHTQLSHALIINVMIKINTDKYNRYCITEICLDEIFVKHYDDSLIL